MGIYQYISKIDSKSAFIYIGIIIVCVFIAKFQNITLSIFTGIIISVVFIVYLDERRTLEVANKIEKHKHKADRIRPYNEKFEKYTDITDFIYSIQEYYYYNPEAHEELLDALEQFLTVYENSMKSADASHKLYEIADRKKHDSLNALHSMIYTLPADNGTNYKHETALHVLEKLLKDYQEKIYFMTQKYVHENGYDVTYKMPQLGPKAHNFYSKEEFTYDVL